jgi:hypothetical protein
LRELEQGERCERFALRAQAKTARGVEARAAMKRPPVEAPEAAAKAPQSPLVNADLSGRRGRRQTEKSGGPGHRLNLSTAPTSSRFKSNTGIERVSTWRRLE